MTPPGWFHSYVLAGAAKSGGTVPLMPTRGPDSKESTYNAGDPGLISGLGRSPEEMAAHSLASILVKCSCLDNPMDRGAWQVTAHGGHKESDMTE